MPSAALGICKVSWESKSGIANVDARVTAVGNTLFANAYAAYVVGASMEPRYHPGEVVHIHPGRPVDVGAYVLVQRRGKTGEAPLAVIKRLAKRTASKITLEQFNPPRVFDIKTGDIVSIHRVVGSGEA